MQTITDDLRALLKSKFQAAADGFRARVVIGDDPADPDLALTATASDSTWGAGDLPVANPAANAIDGSDATYTDLHWGGGHWLHLDLGRLPPVHGALGADVARTATATYSASNGGPASNAIDGDDSTYAGMPWFSGGWLHLDLGSPQSVGSFRVLGSPSSQDDVYLQSSPDDSTWTHVYLLARDYGAGGDTGVVGFKDSAGHDMVPVVARYWRLFKNGAGGNWTIGTFSLFEQTMAAAVIDGSPKVIESFRVCQLGNSNDYYLQSSTDDASWTTQYTHSYTDSMDTGVVTFGAPITARYWRIISIADRGEWHVATFSLFSAPPPLIQYRVTRVSIDHSLQTDADAFEVELDNSDGSLNLSNPDTVALPGRRIRIFQWYGDPANEVQVFDGFIDKVAQHG